jgi:hypothetical protein
MSDFAALSLGAGVQSTTIALLSIDGTLPKPDHAIFADTGWEPAAVYAQVDRIAAELVAAGVEFHRVSLGNLRDDALDPAHRYASIPYFVRNPDGSEGMGRRQCTSEYKLTPIRRKLRELLGAAPPDFRRVPRGRTAEQWIGFSTDEVHRANNQKDSNGVRYLTTRYPLLDLGWSRRDCRRYLERHGWGTTIKSACIGCPFHGNRQWRVLRDTCACGHIRRQHHDLLGDGDGSCSAAVAAGLAANLRDAGTACPCQGFNAPEWHDAVAFDAAIRKGGSRGLPLDGEAFLHRSRVPLDQAPIDHRTNAELDEVAAEDQMDIFDVLEEGDPDGCSPYGCRTGAPA